MGEGHGHSKLFNLMRNFILEFRLPPSGQSYRFPFSLVDFHVSFFDIVILCQVLLFSISHVSILLPMFPEFDISDHSKFLGID